MVTWTMIETVFPQSGNLATTWNALNSRDGRGAAIAARPCNCVDMILRPVWDVPDPRGGGDGGEKILAKTLNRDRAARDGVRSGECSGDSLIRHAVIAGNKISPATAGPERWSQHVARSRGERESPASIMLKSFMNRRREGKAMGIMPAYHELTAFPAAGKSCVVEQSSTARRMGASGLVLSDLGRRSAGSTKHPRRGVTHQRRLLGIKLRRGMQFYDFGHETFQNAIINGVKNRPGVRKHVKPGRRPGLARQLLLGCLITPFR